MMELFPGNTVASGVLHVIVQVSLILGIVALTLRWQRRKGAAVRHTVCAWGLTAALLCPLATWFIWSQGVSGLRFSPPTSTPAPQHAPATLDTADPIDQTVADVSTTAAVGQAAVAPAEETFAASASNVAPVAAAQPAPPSGWTFSFKIEWLYAALTVFVGVWLTGILFGLVRLVHGWLQQRKLFRGLRPITLAARPDLARNVCDALGVHAIPRLAVAPSVKSPVCAGLFRPTILLPQGLLETLSAAELRAILIHEGAHVLRRDLWIGMLQRVATIVLWMHPWAHLVSRELSQAREEICDNYVLRHENKIVYARMLLSLSEDPAVFHGATATVGLAPSRWGLEDRVNGILDRARNLMTRTQTGLRVALAVGFIGLTLVVSSASVRAVAAEPAKDPAAATVEAPAPDAHQPQKKVGARKKGERAISRRVLPGPRWRLKTWGGTGTFNKSQTETRMTITDPKAGKMAIAQLLNGADLARYKTVEVKIELTQDKQYPVLASFGFQVGPDFHWVEAPPRILKKGTNTLSFDLWSPEWKCKGTGWHHRTTPQGKGPAHHANLVFHGLDRGDEVVISGFRLVRCDVPAQIPSDADMGPTEVPELLTPQQHDSPDVTRAGILRVHVLNLLSVYAADLKALGKEGEAENIAGVVQRSLRVRLDVPAVSLAPKEAGQ